jgi:hypothetical protein
MNDIDRLEVHVDSAPHPGLIRSRIEAALTGRASDPGPEQVVGRAVATAVTAFVTGASRGPGPGAAAGTVPGAGRVADPGAGPDADPGAMKGAPS